MMKKKKDSAGGGEEAAAAAGHAAGEAACSYGSNEGGCGGGSQEVGKEEKREDTEDALAPAPTATEHAASKAAAAHGVIHHHHADRQQQEEEEESKLLNDVMDMNMMEHDMNLNMQHANDAEREQQQEEKDIILQVKQVMHQQVDDHDDPCAPCSVLRPVPVGGVLYGEYLMLDQLLQCQQPYAVGSSSSSSSSGEGCAHDEHLFIVTHQAYELWFKQIIFELDSVRSLLQQDSQSQSQSHPSSVQPSTGGPTGPTGSSTRRKESIHLMVTSRLSRVSMILKLLVDQVQILETMTPLDFMDFRANLKSASGFQSLQFRLIENKLGVRNELRTNYGKSYYIKVFEDERVIARVKRSESEPSLLDLIESWLERTPGLEEDGFHFWSRYRSVIEAMMQAEEEDANSNSQSGDGDGDDATTSTTTTSTKEELCRKRELFDSVFSVEKHAALVARGERRFSHRALQGALMISLYRDEPRFNQPYNILNLLMDIDSLITKWRYNHVQLVLRMLGSQTMGTGGSSGYQYLRSTLSDRYKVFVDLCNLSTFMIPRHLIPALTPALKHRLSIMTEEVGDA